MSNVKAQNLESNHAKHEWEDVSQHVSPNAELYDTIIFQSQTFTYFQEGSKLTNPNRIITRYSNFSY